MIIIDQKFTGGSRRIYGPVDVAKAAKTEDIDITGTNADSYALFANGNCIPPDIEVLLTIAAMYWNQRLGSVPQPSLASVPVPANYVDGISDAQDNYVVLVEGNATSMKDADPTPTSTEPPPPKGSVCNCNENSCSAESPDCCANGTC